ncbi:serine O-acetyltransferase [Pedobacter vanadiisoli]|uniref:Serine acetyltransferase n=1 Tax=Pedobacter vanadiisoli TaxID=1761975 RepID=A0ABW5MMX3_9SPHI
MVSESLQDLKFLKTRFNVNPILAILTNRGFHALFFYRISNKLYRWKIPIIPLILTRIIQVFYAIDIDFKAEIAGGIIIIHGVGIVIGQGGKIGTGTIIYHGVTLGRKRQLIEVTTGDGYPVVGENCVLGAGAKLVGSINVGANSIIGPNVVLMKSVAENSLVKSPDPLILNKYK